jgi:hypothetical protein
VDISCIIKIKTPSLPCIQLSTVTQIKRLTIQQYLQPYAGFFRGWLTDAVTSRTSLYISQPASQTQNGLKIHKSDKLTLYIEIRIVVIGICKFKSLRTFLNNRLYSSLLSKSLKIRLHRIIILPVVLYLCAN